MNRASNRAVGTPALASARGGGGWGCTSEGFSTAPVAFRLGLPKVAKLGAGLQQLGQLAVRNHTPFVEDDDLICALQRRPAVGNHKRRRFGMFGK